MLRVVVLVTALVLVGCGVSDESFYDGDAKEQALRAAKKDPFRGYGKVVSVGSAHERDSCPQAPSADAGPCFAIPATTELPLRDLSGQPTGKKTRVALDLFVWLEKPNGRWKVMYTTYRPQGAEVDLQPPG
jgi:hypothetical protein